jgi:putative tryptophan/tyrosine transport system substrate-binding protein
LQRDVVSSPSQRFGVIRAASCLGQLAHPEHCPITLRSGILVAEIISTLKTPREHNRPRTPRAEFVELKFDVIVTTGPAAAQAKKATSVIPIVLALSPDPVGAGLVASLARPGGNVTGLSMQLSDTAGKRLELLREAVPSLRRLAIMANVGFPQSVLEMGEVQVAARTLGIEVATLEIRREEDIVPALASLKADSLYVTADALLNANRIRINTLANVARLPTIAGWREFVEAGSLMSYGPSLPDLFRRAADLVDKILRGAKPADIPVEQPTKFDFVINLKTAKTLGLAIPELFLSRADELIE